MRKIFLLVLCIPLFAAAQIKQITLDDIYKKGTFRSENVPGFNSLKDGRYYTELDNNGNLIKKSFATGETAGTLISKGDIKDEKGNALELKDFEWSDDESKLLIFLNREFIYRRSSKAIVYAYDLSTNKTTQITKDGKWNFIINGNCDWVYEEEFGFTRAFQWSPKSDHIAYYRFDESKVPTYAFAVYDSLYPKQYSYKYPKAGEANSVIEIHIYDTKSAANIKADIGKEVDIYIPRIVWTKDNSKLAITWLNRLQNDMRFLSADASTGKTSIFYEEKNKYYVDVVNINFLKDGKHFLITSEKDGYQHIYLESLNGKEEKLLTKGNFDIVNTEGVDEKNNKVYFIAAYHSPLTKDFCSVDLDGNNFKLMDGLIN